MITIKKLTTTWVLLMVLTSTMLISQKTEAVPAFARQTGMECSSCHYQNFPALNSFGRIFRGQGYTMTGAQPKITSSKGNLSLPATLNASVITKIRYHSQSGDTNGRGEIQWPDEAAILVGGRAAENVGFLMELGLGPQEGKGEITETGIAGTKQTVTSEVTGNFLSTKFHFNINDEFAIIPFSTDGLGVGYGFELLNTGAQRSQRPIENRKGFSAYQKTGVASGGATGLAFVYHKADMFINFSHWAPTFGNTKSKIGDLANYIRAVYMPTINGWDIGIGFSSMSGKVNNDTTLDMQSTGLDFQAQGELAGRPTGFYASYVTVPSNTHYNSNNTDSTSLGLLGKTGFMANKLTAFVALNSYDIAGASESDTTIGAQYMVAENIKLELNIGNSTIANSDFTQFMLFAGF